MAALGSAWVGLLWLERLLAWLPASGRTEIQALSLAWIGSSLAILALLSLGRSLSGLRAAMSCQGRLRAGAVSALTCALVGALAVLLPCFWISGPQVSELRVLGLTGIVVLQVAGLAVLLQTDPIPSTKSPWLFAAVAWILPGLTGGVLGGSLSGSVTFESPGGWAAGLAMAIGLWAGAFALETRPSDPRRPEVPASRESRATP